MKLLLREQIEETHKNGLQKPMTIKCLFKINFYVDSYSDTKSNSNKINQNINPKMLGLSALSLTCGVKDISVFFFEYDAW